MDIEIESYIQFLEKIGVDNKTATILSFKKFGKEDQIVDLIESQKRDNEKLLNYVRENFMEVEENIITEGEYITKVYKDTDEKITGLTITEPIQKLIDEYESTVANQTTGNNERTDENFQYFITDPSGNV